MVLSPPSPPSFPNPLGQRRQSYQCYACGGTFQIWANTYGDIAMPCASCQHENRIVMGKRSQCMEAEAILLRMAGDYFCAARRTG